MAGSKSGTFGRFYVYTAIRYSPSWAACTRRYVKFELIGCVYTVIRRSDLCCARTWQYGTYGRHLGLRVHGNTSPLENSRHVRSPCTRLYVAPNENPKCQSDHFPSQKIDPCTPLYVAENFDTPHNRPSLIIIPDNRSNPEYVHMLGVQIPTPEYCPRARCAQIRSLARLRELYPLTAAQPKLSPG